MAAVLTFDSGVEPSLVEIDEAVGFAFDLVAGLPARLAVPRIQRYQQDLSAIQVSVLAGVIADDGDREAERIVAKSGKVSKSAKKKAVARAKLGAKNPAIAVKMAAGDLTDEQVDAIADADRKTDGAAGCDDGFVDAVVDAGVDQCSGVAAEFIADNADADGTQSRYERQRLARKASQFATDRRTEAIMFEGDSETINEIWSAATKQADIFYRHDGGRDVTISKHPRTSTQRQFDALVHLFRSSSQPNNAETHIPGTDTPVSPPTDTGGSNTKRTTPKKTTVRPTIVVSVTLEKFVGLDPDNAAQLIGTGPIADSVLAEYLAADADIVGLIFGHDGQPLWLGRNVRLASQGQILGLIIRDKRCVLCGAHHSKCRAHHTMPWNAPAKGRTDLSGLVLVCDSCHHHIHDTKQTIYHDTKTGLWKLRDALPHEISPPRPPQPQRGQAPQRT